MPQQTQPVAGRAIDGADQMRVEAPCDTAYREICAAQEHQANLIEELVGRIEPVLRDRVPNIGSAGHADAQKGQLPQSPMHGLLLNTLDRTLKVNDEIANAINRLTI